MSFLRGLKKLTSAVSGVEKTVDKEYDDLKNKYNSQKKRVVNVQKNMKSMVNHLDGFTVAFSRLMSDLGAAYPVNSPMKSTIASLEQIGTELTNSAKKFKSELVQNSKEKFDAFDREFSSVGRTMGRREDSVIEYDKLRSAVKKIASRPQDDPNLLPKKKDELKWTKKTFDESSSMAKKDIHVLLGNLDAYYNPAVKLLVTDTFSFTQTMTEQFAKMDNVAGRISTQTAPKQIASKRMPPPPSQRSVPKKMSVGTSKKQQLEKKFSLTEWYYLNDQVEQIGPFNFQQLKKLYTQRTIESETHIFGGDLKQWTAIGKINGMELAMK